MKRIFSLILTLLLIVTFPLNSIAEVVFYDTNHIGSPVAMWDKNGKKVWEGEYYPFGEEYRVSKTPQKNKKRFIGKEKDEETGLTYFGARYMDEKTGRFITPDPVRTVDASSGELNQQILFQPQRLNRYSYSLNNPYRYVDPDGRDPHQWADGNYSDNDGQENPGLYALHKKAQSQVGKGIVEGRDYCPALIVGTGTLGVSVAGVKGIVGLLAKATKSSKNTQLFRAVKSAERASIQNLGIFTNPEGIINKYFSTTKKGAQQYGTMAHKAFKDGPYSIVETSIPTSQITNNMKASVDRGISTITVPTEKLKHLSKPKF